MVIEKLKSPFSPEALRGMAEDRIHAEYAGIPETMDSFWLSLDSIILEEIEHRKGRLAHSLERPDRRTRHEEREKKQHNKSIIQLDKTLKLFRKERKKLAKKKVDDLDKLVKDRAKFEKIREKSLSTFQDSLLDNALDPDVAVEIYEILVEVFGKVDTEKGIGSVLDNIENLIEELERTRSKENKGREHRSPLLWWKWAAIALYLGVAIYFLYVCWQKQSESFAILLACIVYRFALKRTAMRVIEGIIAWC